MIGLFLITHYTYGESLIQSVHHVLNTVPPQLEQLGVMEKDDPLDLLPRAREMVQKLDSGNGVLIMTDVYGASPSNIVMKLLEPRHIEKVDISGSSESAFIPGELVAENKPTPIPIFGRCFHDT